LRVQEELKRKKKTYAEVTENTEYAEKRKTNRKQNREKRERVALERKSPPFAENAKDGAPSSTAECGVTRKTHEHSPFEAQGKQE